MRVFAAALAVLSAVAVFPSFLSAAEAKAPKIPVILDTDIGDDIDDTWALAMLLKCPELDLKLVVSDTGNTVYRAKLIAKLLETAKRTDVPVGVGRQQSKNEGGRQAKWIEGYDLAKYPGKVHQDGVQAIIDTIMNSPKKITLICIGPVPNIAEALKREPRIAERARFVGMHGSVKLGYGGKSTPDAEWNVKCDPKSCQKVFTAAWPMTITPLDTCGLIRLTGNKYRKVAESADPLAKAVIENYHHWLASDKKDPTKANVSSTLFDTVAIYLAFAEDLAVMEKHNLVVTDDGFTRIDPKGKPVSCAMSWKDLGAFEDLLVERLTK